VDGQRDLANRLHSAAIHLLRHVRRVDDLTALTPARLSALSVVGFAGPKTVSELAAMERVSLPTMSRLVAALEADGLVAREADRRDGRLVRIAATERGLQVLHEGRARRTAQLEELLLQLSPEELADLGRAVAALERLLGSPH
jgi:DNA-binding MarR family transcriptional regulator